MPHTDTGHYKMLQQPQHKASGPPQILLGILVFTAVIFPQIYQPSLNSLWHYLYHSPFYNRSFFETVFTMASYIFAEPLYTYKFIHNPALRIDVRSQKTEKGRWVLPKMKRPTKRLGEFLTYAAPLFCMDLVMVKKFADVPLEHIVLSAGYPIDYMVQHSGNTTSSHANISPTFLLPSLHNFSWKSPLQLTRALPPVPPTSRRLVCELAAAFFIYDTLFFFAHLAFHRVKPLAQMHEPHHKHTEMHPQVTNKLSVGERLTLIMLANFALNIIKAHAFTRTCFIPVFVYLFIEVHCGMDLPWGYDKWLPAGWGSGAKAHAHHHRTGRGTYAPFFGWWDAGYNELIGA
ncbi:hypothetical protein LTR05_006638 [Lithohypha guttulata]|uniref:Fatty acid hydroxylase domain-containing protein n=1 Tax=Lithohypha guttulata TaxID=1690604 RepID=A0AAN7SWM3_9EURO|nr:hypothetical protein LTR05_006638 [Lithohypha guttulata]